MSKRSSFRVYDEVGGGVALQKSALITATAKIGADKRRLYKMKSQYAMFVDTLGSKQVFQYVTVYEIVDDCVNRN